MSRKSKPRRLHSHIRRVAHPFRILWSFLKYLARTFWHHRTRGQRALISLALIAAILIGSMYAVASWYIASNQGKPRRIGVTFIPSYARNFGLDPEQTFNAMVDDLNIRLFRLVSYWDEIEIAPGEYDFSELDWQFKKAESAEVKVSLALGLRQPRWPECHMPDWAEAMPKDDWYPRLKTFMSAVVKRYQNSPALESYQLENEYFLKAFGECKDFERERLVDEYNLVKSLDTKRPVIVARSNNAIGFPIGEPTPDMYAVSVYKRVWDKAVTKRYFEYPFPAWFYAFLAGGGKILTGRDMIIHELQAEPWPPGTGLKEASLEEQNKSMNPQRIRDRIEYGRGTGMRDIYLWGGEWWYWRKVTHHDSGVWDVVKQEVQKEQVNAPEVYWEDTEL